MASQIQLIVQNLPKTRRLRRVRPARFPLGIERRFVADNRDLVRAQYDLINELLLPRLAEIGRLAGVREDSARLDQSTWRALLRSTLSDVRQRYQAAFGSAAESAEDAARSMSLFSREEIARQMRQVVGVDVFSENPELADLLEQFVEDNVSRITTTSAANFDQIERIVSQGFRSGQRANTVGDAIVGALGVAESRAAFWARDQIGSLNGQLTKQRQEALGLEEYIWSTSRDELVRETHRQLEGTTQRWDDPPTVGSRQVHPGEDYNCLVGITEVISPAPVNVAYRRRFSGELTRLVTGTGKTLLATPNHPVLTNRGLLPAEQVQVGDYLGRACLQGFSGTKQDVEYRQAPVAQIFDFLSLLYPSHRVAGLTTQFHGDGVVDEQVDVVLADRSLVADAELMGGDRLGELALAVADSAPLTDHGARDFLPVLGALGFPSYGVVRSLGKALTLGFGSLRHALEHRGASTAWLDAVPEQVTLYGRTYDAVALRQVLNAFASQEVAADFFYRYLFGVVRRAIPPDDLVPGMPQVAAQVVGADAEERGRLDETQAIRRYRFSRVVDKFTCEDSFCDVYNLETECGWYLAQGFTVGNCRCTATPKIPGVDAPETSPADVPRDPDLVKRKRARDKRRRERNRRRSLGQPTGVLQGVAPERPIRPPRPRVKPIAPPPAADPARLLPQVEPPPTAPVAAPVPAPTPKPAPKARPTVVQTVKPSDKRLPDRYFNDPTIKGAKYEAPKLAGLLSRLAKPGAVLDKADALEVRRQLNGLGIDEGFVNRDTLDLGTKRGAFGSAVIEDARGLHYTNNGDIIIHNKVLGDAAKALGRKPTRAQAEALNVVVHEAMHGHSPRKIGVYNSALGKGIEEATTELASTALTSRITGVKVDRAYSGYIGAVHESIEQAIGAALAVQDKRVGGALMSLDTVDALAVQASQQLKRRSVPAASDKQYAEFFASDIDWPDELFEGTSKAAEKRIRKQLAADVAENLETTMSTVIP